MDSFEAAEEAASINPKHKQTNSPIIVNRFNVVDDGGRDEVLLKTRVKEQQKSADGADSGQQRFIRSTSKQTHLLSSIDSMSSTMEVEMTCY
eukprot:scaffold248576_cov75-Cyclotella_meneghiniana.AAC.1